MLLIIEANSMFYEILENATKIAKQTYIPYFKDFVLDGMLKKTQTLLKKAEYGLVVRDSKSFRKQLSAEYKSNRTTISEHHNIIDEYLAILQNAGVSTYHQDGLEGDDLCRIASNLFEGLVVVYTNDGDLLQIANHKTAIFLKKTIHCLDSLFYKFDRFSKKYITANPVYELLKRVLFGDNSDMVNPLCVKSKKLDDYLFGLNEYFDIQTAYANRFEIYKKIINTFKIEIDMKDFVRNFDLVCLVDDIIPTDVREQINITINNISKLKIYESYEKRRK